MKVENGKIVEATEAELFNLYLDRGYDDCMDFHEYRHRMEKAGCEVREVKWCATKTEMPPMQPSAKSETS